MPRIAVTVIAVAMLLVGLIAGRLSRGDPAPVTLTQTTVRVVVVRGAHVGHVVDARDAGPFDLARVGAVRAGSMLRTTIVARRPWRATLLRHLRLWILYDTNDDGTVDRRDSVFLDHGRVTSWISSLDQGVRGADVTRKSGDSVTVARDASLFYTASGQGSLLQTSPIGVAVLAEWKGGSDRAPDRGWVVVPPPAT